jgi:peptidoglycan-associated lipoprotein
MKTRLINAAAPLAMLGLLAACSTQPSAPTPAGDSQPGASASTSQTSTRSAPASAVPGSAMKGNTAKVAKRSVYHDYDQSDLKPEQRTTVEANAAYLREHPDLKVRIEGNADERGSREYNLALGQRRAETVMKTMNLLGVTPSRMETVSYGKEKPRASGHDEQSWSENRRSDIVYP